MMLRAMVIGQWVKHLLCCHEGQNLNPQHPCKCHMDIIVKLQSYPSVCDMRTGDSWSKLVF